SRSRDAYFLHGIKRIEPEQRNEFHFVAIFADEEFRAAIAVNFSGGYARKNFRAKHFFVRLRVFVLRPSMPNAGDHTSIYFLLMLVIAIGARVTFIRLRARAGSRPSDLCGLGNSRPGGRAVSRSI